MIEHEFPNKFVYIDVRTVKRTVKFKDVLE